MTVHPNARNLARDLARQSWPKRQPRRPKPNRDGFPKPVQDIAYGRAGGRCELDDCGPASTLHHRGPRSSGGTREGWVNRAANALAVAEPCHLRIESQRTRAYVHGWLVSRNGSRTADQVPVLYRGRWVLLSDDGGVTPIGGVAS